MIDDANLSQTERLIAARGIDQQSNMIGKIEIDVCH